MIDKISIFWFRRDLRLIDNHGLFRALSENSKVLPIFIFDKNILDKLENKEDARIKFIHEAISGIQSQLIEIESSLRVFHCSPIEAYQALNQEYNIEAIYTNHDYEPYAQLRDKEIQHFCEKEKIEFNTFKDQVIFERDQIIKDDGTPYSIYTPYSRKWKAAFSNLPSATFASEELLGNFIKAAPFKLPTIEDLGFKKSTISLPNRSIPQKVINTYNTTRDFPAINGTSKLGVHLRFGTLSIRKLVKIALNKNETFLNELIWREFYMMILWHHPRVIDEAFKPAYDLIKWENDEPQFVAWCQGKTGYPLVDAGMRELNETGYMHNRVRMVVASFLTKHLLIDWRWGEAYFAEKLLDFELASNNGGWQWAAGSGCDAAPYFRVFNPESQLKKFDGQFIYVKKWVPEFGTDQYPNPIIDHKFARERVLIRYKEALTSS